MMLPPDGFLSRPALFERWAVFSYLPSRYLTPTRRNEFFPPWLPEAVWQTPTAHPWLSRHLMDCIALEALEDGPATDAGYWPLALLPAAALERLACHVGVALAGAWLRSVLGGADRASLQAALEPELFVFAMETAPLLHPGLADGPWRDVARADLAHSISQGGWNWLFAALAEAPASVQRRVDLKRPTGPAGGMMGTPNALPTPAPGEAMVLARRMLTFLEPAWSSSFH